MALVTLTGCLVQLHLLIGMLCIGLDAYIPCSNDCGYTTVWTQWSCDSCANNGQNAVRYRGLCCLAETKEHCLNRCHKGEEDINQLVPCHTKCMNGHVLTTTTTTTTATTGGATTTSEYTPSTKSSFTTNETNTRLVSSQPSVQLVNSDLLSSSINPGTTLTFQSALGSTVSSNSNNKTSTSESTIGTVQNSNSLAKISTTKPTVTTKRSTYLTRISTTRSLVASEWTSKVSVGSTTKDSPSAKTQVSSRASSTTQHFPRIMSVTSGPNTFDLSSSNPSNSSPVSTVHSLKETTSIFFSQTTASTDSESYDDNNRRQIKSDKICTWLCLNLIGKKDCNTECMEPRLWNFCTILSAALFFIGVLIGAIATVVLVHCCCHNNKRKGNRHEEPRSGRKVLNPYNRGLYNGKQDKQELSKSPALTKNRRQISPTVSSSTSLIDLNWSPTSEHSSELPQKLQSSTSGDTAGNVFGQRTQQSYDGATNVAATWDTVSETEQWTTQKSTRQPRGNIWITD